MGPAHPDTIHWRDASLTVRMKIARAIVEALLRRLGRMFFETGAWDVQCAWVGLRETSKTMASHIAHRRLATSLSCCRVLGCWNIAMLDNIRFCQRVRQRTDKLASLTTRTRSWVFAAVVHKRRLAIAHARCRVQRHTALEREMPTLTRCSIRHPQN